MKGVDSLILDDTEYVLTPVNQGLSGLVDMANSVSASDEGGEGYEFHVLDVVDSDGTRVLVVKQGGEMTTERGGLLQSGSVDRWYAFETPDSERLLMLEYEEHGWTRGDKYTLRDASTDSVLATWERTSVLKQRWALDDPTGETAAIASKSWQRAFRELLPFSGDKELFVTHPRDSELASIRVLSDGLTSLDGGEVEVTVQESAIPDEILLAFAVGLRREVTKSSNSGDGGDAGGE